MQPAVTAYEPDLELGSGSLEAERVEAPLVQKPRPLGERLDMRAPGLDGIGGVETEDGSEGSP
jgi:hypothetical protein